MIYIYILYIMCVNVWYMVLFYFHLCILACVSASVYILDNFSHMRLECERKIGIFIFIYLFLFSFCFGHVYTSISFKIRRLKTKEEEAWQWQFKKLSNSKVSFQIVNVF